MTDIIKEIAEDDELRQLLWQAFKWRGWSRHKCECSCSRCINKLADKIYEKTGIDLEQYT